MAKTVRIGLAFDYGDGYCRAILRGIKRYAEAKPHWFLLPVVTDPRAIRALAKANPDGLISWAFRQPALERLSEMRRPWVSVCGIVADGEVPRVGLDDVEVGRLAATHLLDRGLRHFGFIGHVHHASAARRELGFRRAVEEAGHRLDHYHERSPRQFDLRVQSWALDARFRRWVQSLPKPVGVSSFYDIWCLRISEVCREMGLRVPDDVAIVGVGNDEMLCELARPSLSSVELATEAIGYEAAALLERLMAGSMPPDGPILLPPIRVVTRQSSDILAVDDPEVAATIRLIRQQSDVPIRVSDILREVPISRRVLERKFRKALNRGVFEEIRRVHLERAKGLLAGTHLSISDVAERAGFSNARHLSVVFRQELGLTPSDFRLQFRGRPSGVVVPGHPKPTSRIR